MSRVLLVVLSYAGHWGWWSVDAFTGLGASRHLAVQRLTLSLRHAQQKPAFEAWYDDFVEEEQSGNQQTVLGDAGVNKANGDKLKTAAVQARRREATADDNKSAVGVRINKCFKNVASRREADRFLEEGRVRVNKRTATTGARVLPGDRVTLDGKLVRWEAIPSLLAEARAAAAAGVAGRAAAGGSPKGGAVASTTAAAVGVTATATAAAQEFVYIKYWKPVGVTSTTDRGDATNVLDASGAERAYRGQRLFNVGRLDKDSSGALLLTSDGRLPGAALSAEAHQEKVYTVTVERRISDAALERMRSGVTITAPVQHSGKAVTAKTLPCQVRRVGNDGRVFEITLREGRNRQIRRMCEELGHKVKFLHRSSFMGITLNGMCEGEWKPLNVKEVKLINRALREAAQRDAPPAAAAASAPAPQPQEDVDVTAAPSVEQRG